MTLSLKVTPQEVRDKAGEIRTQCDNMETLMGEMEGQVKTLTQGPWQSTAGKEYERKYELVKREIMDCIENLLQHIQNLLDAAERYDTAEGVDVASNIVNNLATDDIF